MSSTYTKNRKELAGVKVVPARSVWVPAAKNGEYKLNPDLDIVGKVDMTMPNMILKANRKDKKTAYVDDVSALTKAAKTELINHFYDERGNRNKHTVAYLVRTDKNSKGRRS